MHLAWNPFVPDRAAVSKEPLWGLLVWMVESGTGLWKPACLMLTLVLSLCLRGLVRCRYTSLGRGEWGRWAPWAQPSQEPSPLCAHCLSVVEGGTPLDKRAIPGHQGHRHVWERFLGTGGTLW